jgi:hypothetical protein
LRGSWLAEAATIKLAHPFSRSPPARQPPRIRNSRSEFQANGSDAKIRTAEVHAVSILTLDRAEKAEQEGENAPAELSGNDDTPF